MRYAWDLKVVCGRVPEDVLHSDHGLAVDGETAYWDAVCACEDWFSAWAEETLHGLEKSSVVILIGVAKETASEAEQVAEITLERLRSRDPYPDLFFGVKRGG